MYDNKWQPIETAPTDGTIILTCNIDASMYIPVAACWAAYHPNATGNQCWRTSPVCGNKVDATHWMPLPDPPIE